MNLLERIVSYKREEVEKRKSIMSAETLKRRKFLAVRDFKSVLEKEGLSIIAEIKRMSPSAGIIREDFNPTQIARTYEENGASAISVLTDRKFFGGSNDYVFAVKKEVTLPILRKEFIIDEYQIYESCHIGADAILLIARILTPVELDRFISIAKELGLACLVEIHTRDELGRVLSTITDIIGINNRDLDTFQTDIKTSLELKKLIPDRYITVSESGIKTREDVLKLEEAGFDAVLVGETLMRTKKSEDKLRELFGEV